MTLAVATAQTTTAPRPHRSIYRDAPSLKEVASGDASIRRGHRGEDVLAIQRALNAAGAQPPLAEDGLFGPKTEAALKAFQGRSDLSPDGVLGTQTMNRLLPDLARDGQPAPDDGFARSQRRAPRAPHLGERSPEGSVRAGDLARSEDALRRRSSTPPPAGQTAPGAPPAGPAAPAGPVQGPPPTGPADARLEALQGRAVESARQELGARVREDHSIGNNRGARVDQYAQRAGMPVGGEWCGYFTQFNYSQAARGAGGEFTGSLHSFQKARSFFAYRDYTNNSRARNEQLDATQARHQAEGSTRRFMVLEGSTGERWAREHRRPAESYNPSTLPIRPGDTALFNFGHVGMVESYDRSTGQLTTIEGNVGNRVQRKTYDLNDPAVRARFEGFGRPAAGDLERR